MWFENSMKIKMIESKISPPNSPVALSENVIPTAAFRNWLENMLSTTQVAQNVVILALLFIYRLKMSSKCKPEPGSEYRLMTVALMLGNKCNDPSLAAHLTTLTSSSSRRQYLYQQDMGRGFGHSSLRRSHDGG